MNINKKKQIETAQQASSTIDTVLNWLMIILTFIAVFLSVRYLLRKSFNKTSPVQSISSDYDNFFRNYALVVPRAPPARV